MLERMKLENWGGITIKLPCEGTEEEKDDLLHINDVLTEVFGKEPSEK